MLTRCHPLFIHFILINNLVNLFQFNQATMQCGLNIHCTTHTNNRFSINSHRTKHSQVYHSQLTSFNMILTASTPIGHIQFEGLSGLVRILVSLRLEHKHTAECSELILLSHQRTERLLDGPAANNNRPRRRHRSSLSSSSSPIDCSKPGL